MPVKKKKTNAERMAEFARLTRRQRRVRVAKDVIRLLRAEAITAVQGEYIAVPSPEASLRVESELRPLLRSQPCKVCALGALLVAHVDRFNACKVMEIFPDLIEVDRNDPTHRADDFNLFAYPEEIVKHLRRTFGSGQMYLIEQAYERGIAGDTHFPRMMNVSKKEQKSAAEFGGRYANRRQRLVAIMENIIENKGTFVP